jgi:hydrogenase large subunit
MARRVVEVPLNRVEGDLEIRAEVEDGVVVDAWSMGTLYRGFENLMVGRGALDGLVITPRICGICSTAHLTAAVRALESVVGHAPPPDAVRVRNLALMAEMVQSDVRHALLFFFPDFASPAYAGSAPLHEEAVRRYAPLRGAAVPDAVVSTRAILEVVAILGGQWPHSSFMVPGGVTSLPSAVDFSQCQSLVHRFRRYYEKQVVGCSLERLAEVRSPAQLEAWLDEKPEHRDSHLGFFVRFARSAGLDRIGRGTGAFLSVGGLDVPEGSQVVAPGGGCQLVPAGFLRDGRREAFEQDKVTEDVSHAWYLGRESAAHPCNGETRPYATGTEGAAYSWAKAPRYAEAAVETGPLAEALVRGDALLSAIVESEGPSAFARELARLLRGATLLPAMDAWLAELAAGGRRLYEPGPPASEGTGVGLCQVARGALGHWVRLAGDRITHYQIVTPSAWNMSPRDASGQRGPCEQALVGTPLPDPENPAAMGHVVRSFDPCLVCTVHAVSAERRLGSLSIQV